MYLQYMYLQQFNANALKYTKIHFNMNKILLILTVLMLSFVTFNVNAQDESQVNEENLSESKIDSCEADHNRWYVSGMLGVYQFYGDISENTFFTGGAEYGYLNGMFGLRVGRNFNSRFGAQANFSMGSMSSSKEDLWFDAQTRNLGIDFTLNMTNIVAPYRFNKNWNVTVYLGAGFMGYRSILYNGANNDSTVNSVGYKSDGAKDALIYKSYFNLGTNVAYKINDNFDVFLDVAFTSTPTDDLDAKPITLSELDNYSHTTIGLTYTFGKRDLAYKWNPKPCYFSYVEDEIGELENDIVDMGNKVNALEQCCDQNKIDPCDTSTVDTDGDAVPDCRDLEEDSPKGSIVNFQGIALVVKDPANPDGPYLDGVIKQGNGGAPAIFFSPVYFEYDKDIIDSTGEFTIVNVALYMKQYPNARVLISGNCDKRASDKYNDALSMRRCNKAKKLLTEEYGIKASRFEVQPNGKRSLLFNKHHVNRRVDFSIIN